MDNEKMKRPGVRVPESLYREFKIELLKDPRFTSVQDFLETCINGLVNGTIQFKERSEEE